MNNISQNPQAASPTQSVPQAEIFIDCKEVARRLGCGARTIDRWTAKGFIPFYKINSKVVLFKWSEVESSLKANNRIWRGLD